jgi:Fe-S-cluster-containing dehydrogenase component
MKKWNVLIDVAKCFNCNNCTLALHDEYHGNEFPGYSSGMPKHGHRWLDIQQHEQGEFPMVDVAYLPVTCNHCDSAPCLTAAPTGAVYKREDGIVVMDPAKTVGQRQLVDACPYGAVWWNEEKQVPQIWSLDAHLLDQGWTETRASQVCPTQAMRMLHLQDEEMQQLAREEGLQVLNAEYGTRPRVYYRNLDRVKKSFVGGTLAAALNGVTECIEGATVMIAKNGTRLGETRSDAYGDFRLRDLDADGGALRIEIRDPRFKTRTVDFTFAKSCYVGEIRLEPNP